MNNGRRFALCAVVAASLFRVDALAQSAYPEKPVRIIVPFPAGQTTDVLARAIGQNLSESLKQTFYVENRGGAGGIIGMEAAKRAEPDGYTIAFSSSGPLGINPTLYKKIPYDTLADFSVVAVIVTAPQFLVTRADFPANNLRELIQHVKANPDKLSYGSGGSGLTNHLTMEMFKRQAGSLDLLHVPYRGATAALTGLIGGDTAMMFESGPAIMPHVKNGALKIFAVGAKSGSKALPEVPSVDKAGVPGFDATTWAAVVVPKGVPPKIIDTLNSAIQVALDDPGIQSQFAGLGAEIVHMDPGQSQVFVKSEVSRWGEVIRSAGISID